MGNVCKECGNAVGGAPAPRAREFCSAAHRKAFNNRRMTRGAMLVDLLMTDYTDRDHPMRKSGALQKAARRLLSRWRDEDRMAGRAHCGDPVTWLRNDPPLLTDYVFAMGGNPWSGSRAKPA